MRNMLTVIFISMASQIYAFDQFDRDDSLDLLGYKGISKAITEVPVGLLGMNCRIKNSNVTIILFMKD